MVKTIILLKKYYENTKKLHQTMFHIWKKNNTNLRESKMFGGEKVKIKEGFMLREVVGTWIVVPFGKRVVEFNGLMSLSESAALLWEKMEHGADVEDLVASILSDYSIDEATARADVLEFVSAVKERGLVE
jgi:hypothetical protein